MFGHTQAQPVLTKEAPSIDEAVAALLAITENAQPERWIEFPVSVLLFLSIQGDPESGSLYVRDRKTSTWYWVDFDAQQYGGYSASDFELLIHEYDILSLVERPGLLKAAPGWILELGKPAEMALPYNRGPSPPFDRISISTYLNVAQGGRHAERRKNCEATIDCYAGAGEDLHRPLYQSPRLHPPIYPSPC